MILASFNPDITLGNVISWAILIAGAGAFWQRSKTADVQICALQKQLDHIDEQGSLGAQNANKIVLERITSHESRIQALEKMTKIVYAAANDLKWMKSMMASRWGMKPVEDLRHEEE